MRRGAGLLAMLLVAAVPAAEERRSGFDYLAPATQALQRDDTQNPATLWVQEGRRLWTQAPPGGAPSCQGCHGEAEGSMAGVAARHPAWDEGAAAPVNLAGRIAACRSRRQQAPPWPAEGEELLSMEAFLARQSRGHTIAPPADPRLRPWLERGRRLYGLRQGQLDLACTDCHDRHAGSRLGGSAITQGQATGYPIYRLEWQALGSLQRRLRNCLAGVRAELPPAGDPDLLALELHLARRAAGMVFEAPAVRP